MRTERIGARPEARQRLGRLSEALRVGEVAAGLDGHAEASRQSAAPGAKRRLCLQPIEAGVELHRVEPFGIELQPSVRRERLVVEAFPPMSVLPTGAPDPDRGSHALVVALPIGIARLLILGRIVSDSGLLAFRRERGEPGLLLFGSRFGPCSRERAARRRVGERRRGILPETGGRGRRSRPPRSRRVDRGPMVCHPCRHQVHDRYRWALQRCGRFACAPMMRIGAVRRPATRRFLTSLAQTLVRQPDPGWWRVRAPPPSSERKPTATLPRVA